MGLRINGNKYGARKAVADGMSFDSRKECRRWKELSLLQRAGAISNLRRQVEYILIPAQRERTGEVYKSGPNKGKEKPGKLLERQVAYVADFVYEKDGKTIVEDCKGMRTKDYIIKRKLMLWIHGVKVKET